MGFLVIRLPAGSSNLAKHLNAIGFDKQGEGAFSIGEPSAEDIRNRSPEFASWSTAQLQEDWTYDATGGDSKL